MGTNHKFHTRKVLPKTAVVAWQCKDEYFYAAEQAAARAKSYQCALATNHEKREEKRKGAFTKYRTRRADDAATSPQKRDIDPVSLAAKRAREH